jgi:hypothetical protein
MGQAKDMLKQKIIDRTQRKKQTLSIKDRAAEEKS